jgi:uncharacterized protein (DUF362 family)
MPDKNTFRYLIPCILLSGAFFWAGSILAGAPLLKKQREELDALSSASQANKVKVALVTGAGQFPDAFPGPDGRPDTTGAWGEGEIGRIVAEALDRTGLPSIWPGSPVRSVLILTDLPRPVYDSGVCTSPHVTAALVRYLFALDSTLSVQIAGAPEYWASLGTPGAPDSLLRDGFAAAGYRSLAQSLSRELPGLRLSLADLSQDSTRSLVSSVDGAAYPVSAAVARADFLIVAPKLKTGPLGLEGALACLRLALPGRSSGWPRFAGVPASLLDERVASLAGALKPDYVLVDGINCLEGAGTPNEAVAGLHAIVAGEDPLAVDAVCARLAGFDPLDLEYLDLACAAGLGVLDRGRITVSGSELTKSAAGLARPRRTFSPPALTNPDHPYQGQGARSLLFFTGPRAEAAFDSVSLPFPGAAAWTAVPRSPDEPVAPPSAGDGAYALGVVYFWCDSSAEAELWVGALSRVRVKLDGRPVLDWEPPAEGGGFRVPGVTVPVHLAGGCGRLEVLASRSGPADSLGLFSLQLARAGVESKYAGGRVPGLVWFTDPSGGLSGAGLVGIARAGLTVEGKDRYGAFSRTVCGEDGGFVLHGVAPGAYSLKVYDPLEMAWLADTTLALRAGETVLADLRAGDFTPRGYRGDFNADNRLGVGDVLALLTAIRKRPWDPGLDFNRDGRVDIQDARSLAETIVRYRRSAALGRSGF